MKHCLHGLCPENVKEKNDWMDIFMLMVDSVRLWVTELDRHRETAV